MAGESVNFMDDPPGIVAAGDGEPASRRFSSIDVDYSSLRRVNEGLLEGEMRMK